MKTGRVRTKTPPAPEPVLAEGAAAQLSAPPPTDAPPPEATAPGPSRGMPANRLLGIGLAVAAVIACLVLFLALRRGGAQDYVPVTRVTGDWTAGVTVFGPQVSVEERWESNCPNSGNTLLRADTCVLRDASTYQDKPVDDYREFGYDIYYEETYQKVYEAQDADFVTATLGGGDRWEGNLHYVTVEELDQGTCQQTEYTVWVNDPGNPAQEIEVYLSQCEVWDHVTVTERVYDQARWCQCDVTGIVALGQQSSQGTGAAVAWPQPAVPAGGRTQQSFSAKLTFVGGDYTFVVTTEDPNQYQDYMAGQYYLGVRKGKAVELTKNPPAK